MPTAKKKMATTKKRARIKKTTTKTATKKKVARKKVEAELPQKEYINIYDKDPVLEAKFRLSWVIVGALGIILMSFWFWQMKMSINRSSDGDSGLKEIGNEISDSMDELRSIVDSAKNAIGGTNGDLPSQQDLEDIKASVLQQIKVNLESENWPQHSSELINVSFKYPEDWTKQEDKDSILIASYDLTIPSEQKVFTDITITKIDNENNDSLEDLGIDLELYNKTDEVIFIDLILAKKYQSNNIELNVDRDISYIIILEKDKTVYKIKVYSKNGKNIYESIISKILSTIELI